MEPMVSVIIVNWNGRKYLEVCLSSLFSQTYQNFEVILVDNGSVDGSLEFVRANYPKVDIILLDKNYGFAKANNIGIKRGLEQGSEYIALLNNDTKVEINWLKELVEVAEKDKRCGIYASKILKMDNPKVIDSTGHIFIYGIILDRGRDELDSGQYDDKLKVVGACAGACLYRKEMLEDMGFFDESLVIYYEDAEFSWRAFHKGWRALYTPKAIVYHHRSGTTKDDPVMNKVILEQNDKNMIKVIKKHSTFSHKLVISFWWWEIAVRGEVEKWLGMNKVGGKAFFDRLRRLWSKA